MMVTLMMMMMDLKSLLHPKMALYALRKFPSNFYLTYEAFFF